MSESHTDEAAVSTERRWTWWRKTLVSLGVLAVLLGLALVVGKVGIPYLQVRTAVRRFAKSAGVGSAEAVEELGGAERALTKLRIYLSFPKAISRDRELAIALMGECGRGAVRDLLRFLKDDDVWIRLEAAGALGAMGPEATEAVPALTRALHDADPRVRVSAASVLGSIGTPRCLVMSALQQALQDKDENVRKVAALRIWELSGTKPEAVERPVKRPSDLEGER